MWHKIIAVSNEVFGYSTSTLECLVKLAKNKDTLRPTSSDSLDLEPRILHFRDIFMVFSHV